MSRTSTNWINLGAFGINILSIKQNFDDPSASSFVELKDTDASKSGRPPKVNGSIPNLKARRSKADLKTVVWTVRNTAHHDHVRTFATKFETQREGELFLLIFNSLAAETEERRKKVHEDDDARVTRSLLSSVNVKTTSTRANSSDGVCPNCNNAGEIGTDCDNCGGILEEDNYSTSSSESSFEDDDGEESVDLLAAEMTGMAFDDKKRDESDNDSFEDDFANTQEWPEDHTVSHPAAF